MSPQAWWTTFSADFYIHDMVFQFWMSKCLPTAPSLYPIFQTVSVSILETFPRMDLLSKDHPTWWTLGSPSLRSCSSQGHQQLRRHMDIKSLWGFLKKQSLRLLWERTATISSRQSFLAAPGVQLFWCGWPKQIPSAFDIRHSSGTIDILLG